MICECPPGTCIRAAELHHVWTPNKFGDRPMVLTCATCHPRLTQMYAPPEFTHAPTPECDDAGAIFDPLENRCYVPEPGLADEVEAFLRHPTSQGAL